MRTWYPVSYLVHHGIKDQEWGVKNGPPYPLSDKAKDEINNRRNIINKYKVEYGDGIRLPGKEKEYVYELFDNNLSDKERKDPIVFCDSKYYTYTAINNGHNRYTIINKKGINGRKVPDEDINEVLTELFGVNWEDYDEPVW